MTTVIPSIEEMEQVFESWNVEFHPRTRPFILSEKERNTKVRAFDLAKLKCYYAALQLCLSEHYSFEAIKATLESSSKVVNAVVFDAWKALKTGTDQTVRITELLRKLFPPTSVVESDVPSVTLYEELKQKIPLEQVDYGVRAVALCLEDSDETLEFYSCYVAILAKKKHPDHDLVKASDEKSIFLKLVNRSIPQLEEALDSEESLLTLLSSLSGSLAVKMLDSDFVDPSNVLKYYCSYIERCIELFKVQDEYYSRYTTLCQSSGYGKTRLSMEMSRKFFLVFMCLRNPNVQGFPNPSTIAEYFRKLKSVDDFLVFYLALFSVLDEELSVDAIKRLIESQVANESDQGSSQDYSNSGSAKRARKDSLGIHHKFSNDLLNDYTLNSTGGRFWNSVETKAREIFDNEDIEKLAMTLHRNVENAFITLKARLKERNLFKSFVFIIDEARCLLEGDSSAFLNWRRAIAILDRNLPIFFVLLDTAGKIANFTPAREDDPSIKVQTGGQKLFPPRYLLPFINMVKIDKNNALREVRFEAIVDERDIASYAQYAPFNFSPLVVLEKSRPMFISSYYGLKSIDWNAFYSGILVLARGKLTSSGRLNETPIVGSGVGNEMVVASNIIMEYMAVISCRVPLFPTNASTSDTLVSEYMATMLDVDATRRMVTSYYVPETVLQEAAAHFLRAPKFFERSLQFLQDRLWCRQFSVACSKGDMGKVVVSVCLLRAFDCLVPLQTTNTCSDAFITPRTTHAFFRSLLGKDRFDELELNDSLPCGYLSFTKWHRIECDISGEALLHAFRWRYAIVCAPGEAGIDLIIPCVKAGRERMQIDTAPQKLKDDGLTADDMFPIYIQVKNWVKAFDSSLITRTMASIYGANRQGPKFDQYFSVIFQVGKGEMGAISKTPFIGVVRERKRIRHFLMIPSVHALTDDAEIFSEAAKEDLRKIAQMDRMLDSKMAMEADIGRTESPYYWFYQLVYNLGTLMLTEPDQVEQNQSMDLG